MNVDRVPLKYLAHLNPETLAENTDPSFSFRYVDIGSTGRGNLREGPEWMTFSDSPSRARRILRAGDSILSTVRTYLRAAWTVPNGMDQLVASTGFLCLRPRAGVDARYLSWLVQSDVVIEEVVARSVGVSYPAISPEEVGRIEVPCPAEQRQNAIAAYLDRETARIDGLIVAKRRMINLAKERLGVVVSSATVARSALVPGCGLPSGWKLTSLKRCLSSATYGIGEAAHPEGDCAVLGMGNIDTGAIVGQPGGFVTGVKESLLLRPGDLLFNRTNSRELVGKVGIVKSLNGPTTFASYLVRLRTSGLVEPDYLNLLLNTPEILGLARSLALPSIGQANLNPSRYSSIVLPIPPMEDQRRIVGEMNALAGRFTALNRSLGRQIDLLEERRRALVTAAVAGQLDITEAT